MTNRIRDSVAELIRGSVEGEPPRIALGFDRDRNREFLAELLDDHEVVEFGDEVPSNTDLCIVDVGGFERSRDVLDAWRRAEQPAAAPVLLVSPTDEDDLWRRYGDEMGIVDALLSVPAPKRAVRSRVEGLLELRDHSLSATRRAALLERYEEAMDVAGVGITITDAGDDQPLVYVNDGFCELTGYDREEVIGRNCRFLQGEKTEAEPRRELREAIENGHSADVEIRNYRRSGETFWNHVEVAPIRDDDGEITHFVGIQKDVTERKNRELVLEGYERIVQSMNDPVVVLDGSDTARLTNAAATSAFRPSESGVTLSERFCPTVAASLEAAVTEARRTGETQTRELSVDGPSVGATTYQFRLQPEPFAGGTWLLVVARDITAIRGQQDRIAVLDRVLRHNLRNKLNVVLGHAATLRDDPDRPNPEVAATAEHIVTAAESLLSLSEAARRFGVTTDPSGVRTTEVDLVEELRPVATRLYESHPMLQLTADLPTSAPARCPTQLHECIEAVMESAIDRGHGSASVAISVTEHPERVELRVTDDGPPMANAERGALQAGTETPLEHTQGVDLWLVRWAVEGAGGSFDIETNDHTTVVLSFQRA